VRPAWARTRKVLWQIRTRFIRDYPRDDDEWAALLVANFTKAPFDAYDGSLNRLDASRTHMSQWVMPFQRPIIEG